MWMCVQFVCVCCGCETVVDLSTLKDTRRPVLYEARMRRAYGSEESRDGPLGAGVHFCWLCFRVDSFACMVVVDAVSF